MKINSDMFPKLVKPIRDTDVYSVHDLEYLKHLNVSMTVLHPDKATGGHVHDKEEEVYLFLSGSGEMQLDKETFKVKKGDIVLVKGNQYHRVFNKDDSDLIFLCIFEKYSGRGK